MNDILKLPYYKIRKFLEKKEITVTEIIKHFIYNIYNEKLNSFRELTIKQAIKQAKISDKRFKNYTARKLEGLILGVKDNFCTNGIKTTACSKILKNFIPYYESTITNKVFSHGGIMIGKTNMDEFAMGSSNINSYFGNVVNPYKINNFKELLIPGGSSGGSAVAVAINLCSAALGSDTGGSIRLPASFTGTVGVKPTYGRCSRFGIISFSSSFDQVGILTNNVTDATLILEAISGFDERDSTVCNITIPYFSKALKGSIKGKKIALLTEFINKDIDECIKKGINTCKKIFTEAGCFIYIKSIPNLKYSLPSYYIITSSEMSSNLSRYDGVKYGERICHYNDSFKKMIIRTRSECFGREVKSRILAGTYVLSDNYIKSYFQKAQKIRKLIFDDFIKLFNDIDIIIAPTSNSSTIPISESNNQKQIYNNDIFTVPFSMAGLPAISIPIGYNRKNLPISIQIATKHFDETTMFLAAKIIEENLKFKNRC